MSVRLSERLLNQTPEDGYGCEEEDGACEAKSEEGEGDSRACCSREEEGEAPQEEVSLRGRRGRSRFGDAHVPLQSESRRGLRGGGAGRDSEFDEGRLARRFRRQSD